MIEHNVHQEKLETYYINNLGDPRCQKLAEEVMEGSNQGERSDEQHYLDCIRGIALERAVMKYLHEQGYVVLHPPEREYRYDFMLSLPELHVGSLYVDVKGIFTGEGKWVSQTAWERQQVKNKLKVLYMAVDCRDHAFSFIGEAWSTSFWDSKHNAGGYLPVDRLEHIL